MNFKFHVIGKLLQNVLFGTRREHQSYTLPSMAEFLGEKSEEAARKSRGFLLSLIVE